MPTPSFGRWSATRSSSRPRAEAARRAPWACQACQGGTRGCPARRCRHGGRGRADATRDGGAARPYYRWLCGWSLAAARAGADATMPPAGIGLHASRAPDSLGYPVSPSAMVAAQPAASWARQAAEHVSVTIV